MSSTSSEVSRISSKANGDVRPRKKAKSSTARAIKHVVQTAHAQDILLFLIAFRILNALTLETFFQPDEYFQSLEPAWQLAFGQDSGAWITWEWKHHLRSAIHPAIFAAAYRVADAVANAFQLTPSVRADLLLAGPKTIQAVLAALGDYYTWKLAEYTYGRESTQSWAALALTVANPWQWFCSTRTLSNCLETTLTIIAMYNWPWHWSVQLDDTEKFQVDGQGLRVRNVEDPGQGSVDETTRLRRALVFAALATMLRPTNVLIWTVLVLSTFLKSSKSESLVRIPGTEQSALLHFTSWSVVSNRQERLAFLKESVLCGSSILWLSVLIDRLFYRSWTFPPLNFLYINVIQSLAVFYGNNDWHYYLSQGYPLLLTTALPFALVGLYQGLALNSSAGSSSTSKAILSHLAIISILVPAALSVISHKEVRFIYPILPALHILSASPLAHFFGPSISQSTTHPKLNSPYRLTKRIILISLLAINFIVAFYTTTIHNSGLIEIMNYLRNEVETHYLDQHNTNSPTNLTVGFLMPCHSTPWRSHLQYPPASTTLPSISAWALSCEPPLHLNAVEKATYLDEADRFYLDPSLWIKKHMSRHPPLSFKNRRGVFAADPGRSRVDTHANDGAVAPRHTWPEYLVFFEQLELALQIILRGSGYVDCARIFNSHWHDDWRRRGDIVVWCLYPERARPKEDSKTTALTRRLNSWIRRLLEETEPVRAWLAQFGVGLARTGRALLGQRNVHAEYGGAQIPPLPVVHDAAPVERVVEKPFWKQRPKELKLETAPWWHSIPGLRPKKKTSWWEGDQWS